MDKQFFEKYAKKIFGFSYSKTRNHTEAEDLSQEILLQLCLSLPKSGNISDMDAFVYTICYYTWSKFVRKNIKSWKSVDMTEYMESFEGNDYGAYEKPVEIEAENKIMLERMRDEIAYLGKQNRAIVIGFYYNGKSGEQLAKELGLSHSTIRWHLGDIRKKLKERIEMEKVDYIPKKLQATHWGNTTPEYNQCGLGVDLLVDNICIACYKEPLSISEIARKINVAACYLERHIERLVFMDYLTVGKNNKLQTNFFIKNNRTFYLGMVFHKNNITPYAKRLIDSVKSKIDKIKAIGFIGSELDSDYLMWSFIPFVANRLLGNSMEKVKSERNIELQTPKRKDGSMHWVFASLVEPDYLTQQTEFSDEVIAIGYKYSGSGVKTRDTSKGISSFQIDSRATIDTGVFWRDFNGEELEIINNIAEIIKNGSKPSDYDKMLISKMIEQGYVSNDNDKLSLNIPFFNKEETVLWEAILDEIYNELGDGFFVQYIKDFADNYMKLMPDFLPKEQKEFMSYLFNIEYAVLYSLSDLNLLRYPTEKEAKALCTVVWCK